MIIDEAKRDDRTQVKFIILSQPTLKEELENHFPNGEIPQIYITKDKNKRDIEQFMLWTISQSPKLKRAFRDKDFKIETVQKLAECAGGIFESEHFLS